VNECKLLGGWRGAGVGVWGRGVEEDATSVNGAVHKRRARGRDETNGREELPHMPRC
jgi:hypothetical protein